MKVCSVAFCVNTVMPVPDKSKDSIVQKLKQKECDKLGRLTGILCYYKTKQQPQGLCYYHRKFGEYTGMTKVTGYRRNFE